MRTVYSGLVDEKFIGQAVTLYGWAHRRRDHGGVIFIDLRDREGLVQVVCDPDRPEVFATADKESVTGVMYEPWHFRYVGVEAAQTMTQNNWCLEEYVEKMGL